MVLFSTVTRSLSPKSMTLALDRGGRELSARRTRHYNLRFMSSIRNETNRETRSDDQPLDQSHLYYPEGSNVGRAQEEDASSGTMNRFRTTAEVTVSKIFPAGFCWQASSVIAEEYLGYAPDTAAFALTTGLGDGMGVVAGHCAYFAAKKSLTDGEEIDMEQEKQTGLLLASAAFCSGTAWQPLVAALQAADLSFAQVFAGTWIGCGTAFYLGLRTARTILSGPCRFIEEPSYENSTTDKSLSMAIGGATGFFVGTDTAYLPSQNFLIHTVGIHEATPAFTGCVIAGTSTSLGFLASQAPLNAIYPEGKLWSDGK